MVRLALALKSPTPCCLIENAGRAQTCAGFLAGIRLLRPVKRTESVGQTLLSAIFFMKNVCSADHGNLSMREFLKFIVQDWYFAIPMFAMSLTALTLVIWRIFLNHTANTN